jgi:hypothetical protein
MRRIMILTGSILIIVASEGLAQPSELDATVGELRNQLEQMRSQMVAMQNRIATLEAAKGITEVPPQPDETKAAAEPTAFRFKGLTLTPGGFLNSTALVRARNENADLATSYSAIPLDGSSNANLSELRGTARTSQLSLLIQGSAGNTGLRGYFETDFLGAAPTANYVQFLDSSLEASLDSNRAAVGIDDHCRSDVVTADDQPTRGRKSAGTETRR